MAVLFSWLFSRFSGRSDCRLLRGNLTFNAHRMPGASINAGLREFRRNSRLVCCGIVFVRFSIVGGVGFVIEAALLKFSRPCPASVREKGRAISFPIAVVTTWWLNRTLTFQSKNNPHRESFRYFLGSRSGLPQAWECSWCWCRRFPGCDRFRLCRCSLPRFSACSVNFALSKKYVFAQHEKQS